APRRSRPGRDGSPRSRRAAGPPARPAGPGRCGPLGCSAAPLPRAYPGGARTPARPGPPAAPDAPAAAAPPSSRRTSGRRSRAVVLRPSRACGHSTRRRPGAPPRYGGPMSTPRPSPLARRKPTKHDLAALATPDPNAIDDVLPGPAHAEQLRLLIVGINPGLWTAAVNAPFARPGNRFWPSLHRAGLTSRLVDASLGLDEDDEQDLHERGIGITNMIGRATVRADELRREELQRAGEELTA